MKNRVVKHTIIDGTGSLYIIAIGICIPFLVLMLALLISLISFSWTMFWPVMFLNIPIGLLIFYMFTKVESKKKIAYGYRRSIKEALTTEYPEGVVYILQNVLQELDRFGLDFPPSKIQGNVFSDPNARTPLQNSQTDNDVRGFPNRTNLKEAITQADYIKEQWSQLNLIEKSQAMETLRAKIMPEDIWLDWNKFSLPKGEEVAYWYSYTEEDHRNNQSFSHSTPQTPPPKPQTPSNPSQVLSFEEWVNQNPALQHFSEEEQREAYQRYLKSKGVNILSFDEFLSQNSGLQFFSEEEQQQAYQRYLDSL